MKLYENKNIQKNETIWKLINFKKKLILDSEKSIKN